MENKEKKVLNEEQLDVANGGRLFKKKNRSFSTKNS